MRPKIQLATCVLLFTVASASQTLVFPAQAFAIADGWRRASASDVLKGGGNGQQGAATNLKLEISGDFDGDGKPDTAYVAVNEDRHMYGVFMSLSSGGSDQLIVSAPIDELSGVGLRLMTRGQYQRDCNKDYLSPDCPNDLYLNNDAVVISHGKGDDEVFYINDDGIVSEDL